MQWIWTRGSPPTKGPRTYTPYERCPAISGHSLIFHIAPFCNYLPFLALSNTLSGKRSSFGLSLVLTLTCLYLGILDLSLGDAFLQVLLTPSLRLLYFAFHKRTFLGWKSHVTLPRECYLHNIGTGATAPEHWICFPVLSTMSILALGGSSNSSSMLWFRRRNC